MGVFFVHVEEWKLTNTISFQALPFAWQTRGCGQLEARHLANDDSLDNSFSSRRKLKQTKVKKNEFICLHTCDDFKKNQLKK